MANTLSDKKGSLEELIVNCCKFSIQSAVEHGSGATTSVSDRECWSSLIVYGGVDIVCNTCDSVDLREDKIAFLKSVDRGESHAHGLVDWVVARVSGACTSDQVEHPPVKYITATVCNADFVGWNGCSGQ